MKSQNTSTAATAILLIVQVLVLVGHQQHACLIGDEDRVGVNGARCAAEQEEEEQTGQNSPRHPGCMYDMCILRVSLH